jgi:hypothetical protein
MVRLADVGKETALEALYLLMLKAGLAQRPRPQQQSFCIVKAAVNNWKGDDTYWTKNSLGTFVSFFSFFFPLNNHLNVKLTFFLLN